ncbi:MAG TPA: DUF1993 domain-containing protein [Polyangiaceae bacterium]|nr:DUF1993 domain-containing protein [Polyangiaceae bacterium]
MYYDAILQFKKTLGQFNTWFDKAEAFAKEKSFDANLFLNFRLAPDQLPFVKQVQIACDTAKLGSSRLTGKEVPSHADNEQTLAELRARVASVIAILDGYSEKDFEGASTRSITQPRWEGKVMTGKDYFFEHVQPNFFFHSAHTYAILRHNGVPLGKKDYLGALSQRMP